MFSSWRIKININSILLILLVVLSNILLFCYSDSGKERQVLLLMFVLSVALLIANASTFINKTAFILICFSIISIGVTCIKYGAAGTGVVVICVIICNFVFNKLCLQKKMFNMVHFISAFGITLFLLQFDLSTISARFVVSDSKLYLNTNTYGILVLAVIFHIYCIINEIKRSIVRNVVIVFITVYGAYLIWLSGCRTAIISLCIAILLLIFKKTACDIKENKTIIKSIFVLMIAFPILYIILFYNVGNVTVLGKKLFSGRQLVWEDAIYSVFMHPIFGSGNTIKMYTGGSVYTDVCHNMLLSVLKSFGIVPFLVFIYSFINKKSFSDKQYTVNKFAQFAFISCLFIGVGENFLTDCYLYMPFLLFNITYIKQE